MTHVAVLLPTRDMAYMGFAYDLAGLFGYTMSRDNGIEHLGRFVCEGSLIGSQRTTLVQQALETSAEWFFWLDTDMRFPEWTLEALLSHQKPIVGASYVTRRGSPKHSVAFPVDGAQKGHVPTIPTSAGLEEVGAMGMGCVLMHRSVFEVVPKPWFVVGYLPSREKFVGEDIYFCRHAQKHGVKMYIDHDLSHHVKHIGIVEFDHSDTAEFAEWAHVDDNFNSLPDEPAAPMRKAI